MKNNKGQLYAIGAYNGRGFYMLKGSPLDHYIDEMHYLVQRPPISYTIHETKDIEQCNHQQ